MLATVYCVMVVFSCVSAVMTNNIEKLSTEFLSSLVNAIQFCIKISGMMCFWSGYMNVLKECGALDKLSAFFRPLLVFVYGEKIKHKDVLQKMSASIAANVLGLGNAALPFGISTVMSLEENNSKDCATHETIMFCVLNTVPFQLIPATLVAMRQSYGSSNAFDVVPLVWMCLVANNILAIVLCKIFEFFSRRKV